MEEYHNRKEEKRNINDGVEKRKKKFYEQKISKRCMAVGIFLGAVVVAYAITNLFFMKS